MHWIIVLLLSLLVGKVLAWMFLIVTPFVVVGELYKLYGLKIFVPAGLLILFGAIAKASARASRSEYGYYDRDAGNGMLGCGTVIAIIMVLLMLGYKAIT